MSRSTETPNGSDESTARQKLYEIIDQICIAECVSNSIACDQPTTSREMESDCQRQIEYQAVAVQSTGPVISLENLILASCAVEDDQVLTPLETADNSTNVRTIMNI